MVGKLIYLSHTRPDIAYAISVVSQFMHNPSKEHIEAVVRILRYLKDHQEKVYCFQKEGTSISKDIQMQTGREILLTENPLLDISHLWEVTW